MNDTDASRSLTCVTVAQLNKATRVHESAPWKSDRTVLGKVMLVGNLAGRPELQSNGELTFYLDDSTGRILVKLLDPQDNFPLSPPYNDYRFSTVRVIGTMFLPRFGRLRSITAEHCALAQDPHEPYHHLLRVIVDYMLNEKGQFPTDVKLPVSTLSEDEEDDEVLDLPPEQEQEEGGADFQVLTSSLANTRLDTSDGPSAEPNNTTRPIPIPDPEPTEHLYPPSSPLRSSVSPPRVAYYPKAKGDLDNSFVFLDTEGAPKPDDIPTQHVYPPQRQYPQDTDVAIESPRQEVQLPVTTLPNPSGFAENGDLDESFVFLDSNQVQSRANGAPYLPSSRYGLINGLSISPPTRSFMRRRSPPQRDTPPSKKARKDPYSQLGALERDIIITIHNVESQPPTSLYYGDDKSQNNGIPRDYIIRTVTNKRPHWTTQDIVNALEKLVAEAFLIRPIDSDHFLIN